MTLNCVIIDDEPLAANLLASYAQKTPFLNVIGTYNSAVDGIKDIKEGRVDLIFLDIQMPELSGLELARILGDNIKIVFTTAFSDYAIQSYKVKAVDYLLKPISYEDFVNAAQKALKCINHKNVASISSNRFIFIKSEYKLVKVMLDDILYIEGVKDYVKFYLEGGQKPLMSLMNMKKIEEYLPREEFKRVHRSYIVNMNKVQMVDRFRFVFNETFVPISDSYKDEVQQFIDSHTIS